MARDAGRVVVARGSKVVIHDMKKDPPRREELLKLILGPSGNLRAPTMLVGRTLLVGFSEAAYEQVFR
jgi:arsenate reductase-like glutaredoxin family protein